MVRDNDTDGIPGELELAPFAHEVSEAVAAIARLIADNADLKQAKDQIQMQVKNGQSSETLSEDQVELYNWYERLNAALLECQRIIKTSGLSPETVKRIAPEVSKRLSRKTKQVKTSAPATVAGVPEQEDAPSTPSSDVRDGVAEVLAEIKDGKTRLSTLETQVQTVAASANSLFAKLETLDSWLRTESRHEMLTSVEEGLRSGAATLMGLEGRLGSLVETLSALRVGLDGIAAPSSSPAPLGEAEQARVAEQLGRMTERLELLQTTLADRATFDKAREAAVDAMREHLRLSK